MDSLTPIEAPLESGHVARCRHWPGLLQSESLENWTNSIPWQQNRITVYGKTYDEPRLTAWFGPAYPTALLPGLRPRSQLTFRASISLFPEL